MSRADAEQASRRDFGSVALVKEVTREMWGSGSLERLVQDVGYGLRGIRRAPAFTAVAIVTLALGISANTVVFSAVNGVLLRSLPMRDADRLVMLWKTVPKA